LVGSVKHAASAFLTAMPARHPERFAGYTSWTPEAFEVTSGSAIDVGIDGESRSLDSRLSFSIRQQPLRARLPKHAIGALEVTVGPHVFRADLGQAAPHIPDGNQKFLVSHTVKASRNGPPLRGRRSPDCPPSAVRGWS
jgi:hypothetical protein